MIQCWRRPRNEKGRQLEAGLAGPDGVQEQEESPQGPVSADQMVNYDLTWKPNRVVECLKRRHWIGQTAVCHRWNRYRSYTPRESKNRAADALASNNGLLQSWLVLARLASACGKPESVQTALSRED